MKYKWLKKPLKIYEKNEFVGEFENLMNSFLLNIPREREKNIWLVILYT